MGASGSSERNSAQSPEQQEEESLAATTGSLNYLRAAFSKLSSSESTIPRSSLQECLSMNTPNFKSESESLPVPEKFPELISHLGSSITSLFFETSTADITWVDFLRGFNRCCVKAPASQSLNTLYQLFSRMCDQVDICLNMEFDLGEDGTGKVTGSFVWTQLIMFLWMCWILMHSLGVSRQSKDEKGILVLPDVTHLLNSALVSCGLVEDDGDIWKVDFSNDSKEIPVQKLQGWVLSTAVGISQSLARYVQQKVQAIAASEENVGTSASANDSAIENHDTNLLTRGRAWALSLFLRGALSDQFLNVSFFGINNDDLLYRSSLHGKGLSRFWSNVEGYNGPILLLISAISSNSGKTDNSTTSNKWIVGVLTEQGFESRDTYFGSSAYIFAIDPIFRAFPPSGKEKNFVYCHSQPVRAYQANPKPIGLAFGGTLGNERISIGEEFSRVVVRHHAVDKTYQPGPLFPNQSFLPAEAEIVEVEVWGLGGESVKRQQDVYKKRENIFSEQRRKVDLKSFGNWEDSPEKMMMDMVSDPNRVKREDR